MSGGLPAGLLLVLVLVPSLPPDALPASGLGAAGSGGPRGRGAAGRAGRAGQIIHTGVAGPDHPLMPQLAESGYLKALFYRL